MKLADIRDLSKEDILDALGLGAKPSTTERLLGALGTFGVGLLVGAGVALLMAPKSGQDLREDLGQKFRSLRDEAVARTNEHVSSAASALKDESRV